MVLWWLRLGDGACRYEKALEEVVGNDLSQSTRALLERGFETCAAASGNGDGDEDGKWSLLGRAATSLTRLRRRALGRCPRGGNHRAAEREAFMRAFNEGRHNIISCFPEHLWDHWLVGENSGKGQTSLHAALAAGNLEVAERLLRRGDAAAILTDGIQPINCVFENYVLLDENIQLQSFRLLLRYGSSLNCADGEGNPLVCRAASVSSVKVLKFFFEHGVKTYTCDNSGRNLLHYASKANMVDFLLACGVDPKAADADGRLPVHNAARWGRVEALGALLPLTMKNARDSYGNSPLHLAAQEGHVAAVELLARPVLSPDDSIDCGVRAPSLHSTDGHPREECCLNDSSHRQLLMTMQKSTYDVNAKNSDGCTALHLAVGNGHLEVSEILLSCGADPQAFDNHLHTPFDYIIRPLSLGHNLHYILIGSNESVDLVKLLLEAGANPCHQDKKGRTYLHKAVISRLDEIVRVLLECGTRVNLKDTGGRTALHLAADSRYIHAMKLLLAHGADPSALDDKGETPLNVVRSLKVSSLKVNRPSVELREDCTYSYQRVDFPMYRDLANEHLRAVEHLRAAELLLEAGADPNHRDAAGSSPLHRAVEYDDLEAAELLLKAGADPNLRDAAGSSPLHRAMEYNNVKAAMLLLQAGADPNLRDAEGIFPLHRAVRRPVGVVRGVLLDLDVRADLKDERVRKALHMAFATADDCFVEQLLAFGADHSALDDKGETPLNAVSRSKGNGEFVVTAWMLLKAGADPNHRDAKGSFPLHRAVKKGSLRTAELLLVHGARVDLKDACGRTALHLAAGTSEDDLVKLLLAHGADHSALDDKGETPLNALRIKYTWKGGVTTTARMLLEAGADPNHRDARGSFPLHRRVKKGDLQTAELLLEHGARADLKDARGHTALHLAQGYAGVKTIRNDMLVMLQKSLELLVPTPGSVSHRSYHSKRETNCKIVATPPDF